MAQVEGTMTVMSEFLGRRLKLTRPQADGVFVERDLRVPMDDGVVLLADRYAPSGADPMPTVLVRTPYGRRNVFGVIYGRLYAERGLQVLVQSVRVTFGSGGVSRQPPRSLGKWPWLMMSG